MSANGDHDCDGEVLYMSSRSPTGDAGAVLCTFENGVWGYTPDHQRTRCAVASGERLYATRDDAILAARFRWRCNGGRPHIGVPLFGAEVGEFTERAPAGFMERAESRRVVESRAVLWPQDPEIYIFVPSNHDPGDEDPGERVGVWVLDATWVGV